MPHLTQAEFEYRLDLATDHYQPQPKRELMPNRYDLRLDRAVTELTKRLRVHDAMIRRAAVQMERNLRVNRFNLKNVAVPSLGHIQVRRGDQVSKP